MKVVYGLAEIPTGLERCIVTIGIFDGVHLGHQELLRHVVARAAEIGGRAVVVTFNPHPLEVLAPNNAPRQIQTLRQKLAIMESLGISSTLVVPFDLKLAQTSAYDFATKILWERLHPQEVYVGPNFAFGHRREGSFKLLKEIGEEKGFWVGKIHQVQFRGTRVSSTAVRQALLSGQVAFARRLLGRPFALGGEIVDGTATGSGIQVPTANLGTSNDLIPRMGVYVTRLSVEGCRHGSVTNIGLRPTVAKSDTAPRMSIETHVLDFDQNLYGKAVTLEFLVRLRDERRFPDTSALVAQIQKDIGRARRYFRWLEGTPPQAPGLTIDDLRLTIPKGL